MGAAMSPAGPDVAARLTELTQELLDAHFDTVCLVTALPAPPEWIAHVEYLKDLQRVGQTALAEVTVPPARETGAVRGRRRIPAGRWLRELARLCLPVSQLRRQ